MVFILNTTKNTVIAQKGVLADTFFSRMIGLLNRQSLLPGEALVITRCKSVHMLFMRFPIDAIFIDKNSHVVGLVERLLPFQFSRIFLKTSQVIEVPSGVIVQSRTALDDKIEIKQADN
ncbi:MAG: hypothetical protein A3C36_05875 [Omnitrophica WOR_2 bacterium RIFCSPHIGHO2_02_FULL_52_10]|nr:MAG: hypothetical protein A3C36_05875 [Omnitrophica WOR_2 bacterium RIFCSPHIGHO2_02_FULL_52_10]